jgi:hypothetical protein
MNAEADFAVAFLMRRLELDDDIDEDDEDDDLTDDDEDNDEDEDDFDEDDEDPETWQVVGSTAGPVRLPQSRYLRVRIP